MGITKVAKLQRQLNEARDINRNAATALVTARHERDLARLDRDEAQQEVASLQAGCKKFAEATLADSTRQRAHIRRLFSSIFGPADLIDRERDNLAGARSEKMVASVIDGMDSHILDQVLGRDDEVDFERG